MNDSGHENSGAPGGAQDAGDAQAQYDALIRSDTTNPNALDFDPAAAVRLDQLGKQLYGDGRPAEADGPPPPDANGSNIDFAQVPPDYGFTPDPRLAPHMDALAQHDQLGAIQERAFAAGVPARQFNELLNGILLDILDGKL